MRHNGLTIITTLALALMAFAGPVQAQTASISRGQAIAQRNCSMCHAIGLRGASPNMAAPPFRDLHKRFVVEDLEAGMLSALLRGHPAMPQLRLDPGEVRDLLDYLRSLGAQKTARAESGRTIGGSRVGADAV